MLSLLCEEEDTGRRWLSAARRRFSPDTESVSTLTLTSQLPET